MVLVHGLVLAPLLGFSSLAPLLRQVHRLFQPGLMAVLLLIGTVGKHSESRERMEGKGDALHAANSLTMCQCGAVANRIDSETIRFSMQWSKSSKLTSVGISGWHRARVRAAPRDVQRRF